MRCYRETQTAVEWDGDCSGRRRHRNLLLGARDEGIIQWSARRRAFGPMQHPTKWFRHFMRLPVARRRLRIHEPLRRRFAILLHAFWELEATTQLVNKIQYERTALAAINCRYIMSNWNIPVNDLIHIDVNSPTNRISSYCSTVLSRRMRAGLQARPMPSLRCLSVRPSVCLSRSCIVSKRVNIFSNFFTIW